MNQTTPVYMFDPSEKSSLNTFDVPLIEATEESVKEYGFLVDAPMTARSRSFAGRLKDGARSMKIPATRAGLRKGSSTESGMVMFFTVGMRP